MGSVGFYVILAVGGLLVTTAVVGSVCAVSLGRPRRHKYYSNNRRAQDTQPFVPMEETPPTNYEQELETKQ